MAKTALVTGAAGFTGSHTVELLCERGWDVTATDLKQEGHDKYYCKKGIFHPVQYLDLVKGMDVRFISSDLTDKESLRPLFDRRYDAVFHTASLYDYFAL
ncbi:MAG: NAD(P)-dependent oxidoreductase, partial [bacterium]